LTPVAYTLFTQERIVLLNLRSTPVTDTRYRLRPAFELLLSLTNYRLTLNLCLLPSVTLSLPATFVQVIRMC